MEVYFYHLITVIIITFFFLLILHIFETIRRARLKDDRENRYRNVTQVYDLRKYLKSNSSQKKVDRKGRNTTATLIYKNIIYII